MQHTLALLALAASAIAMPQGVTSIISAGSAPDGCDVSHSGTFAITVKNVTEGGSAKRSIEERQNSGILTLSLADGQLTDQAGRTGYIAANYQFQFDKPPQTGAIFTAGFSLCSNGSLAHGGSAVWYQCKSGSFFNLYDRNWADQCNSIYILAIGAGSSPTTPTGGSSPSTPTAGEQTEGQPTVTTQVSQASDGQPAVTQLPDGQPQGPNPVSQSADGQPEATTGAVSQSADGQPEATTGAVSQSADGQPEATTGAVSEAPEGQPQATTGAVSEAPEGQPQATTGAVSEAPEGQPQATTGAVSESADGQPEATPVTQISDGQPQAPATTSGAVSEAPEGQPEATTAAAAGTGGSAPAANGTVTTPSPTQFTGAAAPIKLYGQEILGAAIGIVGAVALL